MQAGVGALRGAQVHAQEAEGMHLPVSLLTCLGQRLQEILVVNLIQEDGLTPVTPAHEVVNGLRVFDA
jgi:hypothetical protein